MRTGAAVAAALRLADPDLPSLGILGTGTQARQIAKCVVAARPLTLVEAWSPNSVHRDEFRAWASRELSVPVHLAESAAAVLRENRAIAIATSSDRPVVTPENLPGPRLLVSLSAYRRPEIATSLLHEADRIWTDSVAQATARGTLLNDTALAATVCPLADPAGLAALRDRGSTRIIVNTGAAWEEVVVAESLCQGTTGSNEVLDVELASGRPGFGPS